MEAALAMLAGPLEPRSSSPLGDERAMSRPASGTHLPSAEAVSPATSPAGASPAALSPAGAASPASWLQMPASPSADVTGYGHGSQPAPQPRLASQPPPPDSQYGQDDPGHVLEVAPCVSVEGFDSSPRVGDHLAVVAKRGAPRRVGCEGMLQAQRGAAIITAVSEVRFTLEYPKP